MSLLPNSSAFNHQQTCESVIRKLDWDLTHSSREEREDAVDEVKQAVAVLPIGASQRQIQTTAEAALAPFKEITSARRQQKEFDHLCSLEMIGIGSELGSEATWQERSKAEEAVKEAFAAMSPSSTRQQLIAAKEEALAPFRQVVMNRKAEKNKRERDDAKRRLIGISMSSYLDHVNDYVKELEEEYEIENPISKTYEIRQKLEPVLLGELMERDMKREEINEFIEDYVDDELDIR